jgi:hypothetical protein
MMKHCPNTTCNESTLHNKINNKWICSKCNRENG